MADLERRVARVEALVRLLLGAEEERRGPAVIVPFPAERIVRPVPADAGRRRRRWPGLSLVRP